jgi:hypothetical protein
VKKILTREVFEISIRRLPYGLRCDFVIAPTVEWALFWMVSSLSCDGLTGKKLYVPVPVLYCRYQAERKTVPFRPRAIVTDDVKTRISPENEVCASPALFCVGALLFIF